jgi:hypothetical protein
MLIQEKEYSHIRFGLVKLIFNDVMNELIWDSLTDSKIVETLQNQLKLLNFETFVRVDDKTNGLNVTIQVDLGEETGVMDFQVLRTGEFYKE